MQNTTRQQPLNGGKFLAGGFAAVILIGALLLTLPAASAGPDKSIGFADALFTATSAVCVTGLTVIDASADLSRFGQIVLLCLIQVGGLGFLAFSTILFVIVGKRITLRDRLLIRESMNTDHLNGMVRLIEWVLRLTLCVELAGAALLSIRFVPAYGWGKGLYMSVFHSISAFCNAGFDLLGSSSMIPYRNDPLVLFTLMLLITTGGLGFALLGDLLQNRRFSRLEVHTRLVLVMTAVLTLGGAVLILLLEWNNPHTLGALESRWMRVVNALFESVTLRTAGFAAFDQSAMHPATKLLSLALMFIGAAPASTGGGVKMTTFASLVLLISSIARGREQVVIFRHAIPRRQVERATCVFLIALGVVMLDATLLMVLEPDHHVIDVIFESVSAFATVGLTCNLTGTLSLPARLLIILTMFIGRVGPLTLTLAISHRQASGKDKIKYPEAGIMIG